MVEGTASTITMLERRSADGLDADVPIMMLNGAVYDDQLDRFFFRLAIQRRAITPLTTRVRLRHSGLDPISRRSSRKNGVAG
jgi:hypothetical protein